MKIKNILVSQPTPAIPEKSPYHEIHARHDSQISYRPFIKVEGVSLKEYRSQRVEILDHSTIIFTSRTTVDHFFRICEEARITVPETMKYICNNETVALYLQKYIVYRKRKIFFANGTFANLMELILKHKGEKFLLTLSEPHKLELPDTLEKLKIDFNKVILSRTVSAELSDLDPSKYDILVFFSPAEISALTSAFGIEKLPLIAAFGDGTARAAVDAGLTVNVMAPTPEAPSMAKAIDLFLKKVNAGEVVPPVELAGSKQADEFLKSQQAKPRKKAQPNGANGAAKKNGAAQPNGKANGKVAVKKSTGEQPAAVPPAGKVSAPAKAAPAKSR